MGTAPPYVLGRRIGRRLAKHRRKVIAMSAFPDRPDLGTLVGRALVRGGHRIEFRRGDDWEDWRDPSKVYGRLDSGSRSGLAGKFISHAETGGRIGRDLYSVLSGENQSQPSAQVGNFKITPNSPNTARVTVGPERRQRRKKYEWERAETKRKIQKAIFTAAVVGGAAAGVKLHNKGGGSILKGIGVVAKESANKTREVATGIGNVLQGKAYVPGRKPSSDASKKIAEMITKKRAAETTAKAAETGVVENPDIIPFKKEKKP